MKIMTEDVQEAPIFPLLEVTGRPAVLLNTQMTLFVIPIQTAYMKDISYALYKHYTT